MENKKNIILLILKKVLFILVYFVFIRQLYSLLTMGKTKENEIAISICLLFFIVYIVMFVISIFKKKKIEDNKKINIILMGICVIFIISITAFFGFKTYKNVKAYEGKLAWKLNDLKNKKTVKFADNNIYKDGIEGIIKDVNSETKMPSNLYLADNFSLTFDETGTITSFDTYVYGKDSNGNTKSYLLSYNANSDSNILIYLNGYVKATYSKDKLLKPLLDTVKAIPLKNTIKALGSGKYGIVYEGVRSFGYNTAGITYVDAKGRTLMPIYANNEIKGYFVSVYVTSGKNSGKTPYRYELVKSLNEVNNTGMGNSNGENSSFDEKYDSSSEYYLSKNIAYRLEVDAAALGSRSYKLMNTKDGGQTWSTINKDPFNGNLGVAAGITFIGDKLSFACLSISGGKEGQLYRSDDGGVTYKTVNFPKVQVPLGTNGTYDPFDLPGMPYKDGNALSVLVGQGEDADYNGGIKALYKSMDNGITWSYVKQTK